MSDAINSANQESWRRSSFAKAFAEQLRFQTLPTWVTAAGQKPAPLVVYLSNSPRLTASPSSSCLLGNTWLTVPSISRQRQKAGCPLGLGFGHHLAPGWSKRSSPHVTRLHSYATYLPRTAP
ncbi:hypothetical protein LX32DRAFT_397921 [Colletotrichum zoysiae]|uniref:Uncharacterized protein n=1 Tax=Colletotrichum zoysiae TaxID=1216348 RepID=A0AAD9M9Z0_9PEZI|nr:hypothetical protein LX32DRAFT_397921 [Colletotrichum zoysiae]